MKILFNSIPNNNNHNLSQIYLIKELRESWGDYVWLTRAVIVSTANDLGDLEDVSQKLIKMSEYIDLFNEIYGIEKARILEEIIKNGFLLSIQLINQLKEGNDTAADMTRIKWYENADKEAEFYASLNPYLNKNDLKSMLRAQLDLLEKEARLYLEGKDDPKRYAEEIAYFDLVKAQALDIADYLSAAIITQFNL